MPPKRKHPNEKPKAKGKKKVMYKESVEVAEVADIIDERGGGDVANARAAKKHEYLCTWTDGAAPQWVAAKELEGSAALEDWEWREDAQLEQAEEDSVLHDKCQTLVRWIRQAKRPVFLMGAGISAPVLPTFRGTAGLWTRQAHQHALRNVTPSQVQPTLAHRALTALERAGHVYWAATQNYDDLSHKSGFPNNKLSELHGNIFTEHCGKCHKVFHRDFEVPKDDATNHETGRQCEECGGDLFDSIIHFEEDLPWHELKMANAKFCGSDLTIVLGSSLRVEPAASLPFKAKRRLRSGTSDVKRAVIVNLQPTRCDDEAELVIRGSCNDVLDRLAKSLVGEAWDNATQDNADDSDRKPTRLP